MKGPVADLRHAWRQHSATPVASGLAVVLLAGAMAVLTTFLSFWSDASLTGRAGFRRSRELVTIGQDNGRSLSTLSLVLIQRMQTELGSLKGIAGTRSYVQTVVGSSDQRVETELVTSKYFSTLRPGIRIGRGFEASDHVPGAAPVVILSYRYWQDHYSGENAALGRTIRVRGPDSLVFGINPYDTTQTYRIVGVMEPDVGGTFSDGTQMWMPYEQAAAAFFAADAAKRYRRSPALLGVGRLARGSTAETVTAEIRSRYGKAGMELGLFTPRPLDAVEGLFVNIKARRDFVRQVQLFLASSVLLALVAACNVSLFLLSRAPGRHRELAIRMAVGATARRLSRLLATEAALLIAASTLLGLLASLWLTAAMRNLSFLKGPLARPVSALDWRVLAIVAVVAFGLALLVSSAPIFRLRTLGIPSLDRTLAARTGWAQRLAATIQLAGAGVLASAALALVWHLAELSVMDRGFHGDNVFVVTPRDRPAGNPFKQNAAALVGERRLRRELIESIPGVRQVAFGTSVPGTSAPLFLLELVGPIPDSLLGPRQSVRISVDSADGAYTRILGIPIVHGRELEASDNHEGLVNEALARALWGRTDVTDKTLPLGPFTLRVVGVVHDVAYGHPGEAITPRVLVPGMGAASSDQILIKGDLGGAQLRSGLASLIDAGRLDFKIGGVDRVSDLMARQLAPDRARAALTLASALFVVLLAAVGFYGTQRYLVGAGRREFALREALGAEPRELGRLVVRRSLRLAAPGFALALPLGFLLVVELRNSFARSHVSPYAIEFAVAAGIVALVLAASRGPARLARLTEASVLLREE